MKRILFIDNMGPKSHMNFNKIQIKALQEIGAEVDIILGAQFKDSFDEFIGSNISYVSTYETNRSVSHLKFRFELLKQWSEIRRIVNKKIYDLAILSHFDTYLLPLLRLYKIPIYAFIHSPKAQIDSFAKGICCKISAVSKFIIFNTDMQKITDDIGLKEVCLVPHGFGEKFINDDSYQTIIGGKKEYIFCPSAWSTDITKLQSLLDDPLLIDYCKDKNIYFILKNKTPISFINKFVISLPQFIPTKVYESLMKNSRAVLLCYGPTFTNKVSGIFHECMNNNIRCIYLTSNALNVYKPYLNYNGCFETINDLISRLEEIHLNINPKVNLYTRLDELNPAVAWKNIICNNGSLVNEK